MRSIVSMETHQLLGHSASFAVVSQPALSRNLKLSSSSSSCSICFFSYKCDPNVNSSDNTKWNFTTTGRSKFNPYQDYFNNDDEVEEDEFGFGGSRKKRAWWSDDVDYEDDDEEEEEEFWGFKWIIGITIALALAIHFLTSELILRAFGWMVPAVLISTFLGTGMNTIFMAIALPLGQTALSLVLDKVWGRTVKSSKPWPRNRSRKKPYARAASSSRKVRTEQEGFEASNGRSYPSSVGGYSRSAGNEGKRKSGFGGWDDLDREKESKRVEADEQSRNQRNAKLSRRIRNRERPLLLRLLIALFPFLGTWTRFL